MKQIRLVEVTRDDQYRVVADILTEAAVWMIEQGIENWSPESLTLDAILRQVEKSLGIETWYLAHLPQTEAFGTCVLSTQDLEYWPDMDDQSHCLFVHKLAVRRKFAGQNLGMAMVAAAGELARSQGKRWLCLDCRADRPRLKQLYIDGGLTQVEDCIVKTRRYSRFRTKL